MKEPGRSHKAATERILIAGFGGQGVLSLGKLLVAAGMKEGRHVSYLPSYGAEVRGGSANCHVVISDKEIASPMAEYPDSALLFSQPSYDRFWANMKPASCLILNTSTIKSHDEISDKEVDLISVPATEIAAELGNSVVANLVMIGAYLAHKPVVSPDAFWGTFQEAFGKRKSGMMELNRKAFERGQALVQA